MTVGGSNTDAGPMRLGQILPAAQPRGDNPEAEVARIWASVVGEDVARNAHPHSLKRGRLTVTTSSPAWAQTLQLLGAQLMEGLNRQLGEGMVAEVVFRHSGWISRAGPIPGSGSSSDAANRVVRRTLTAEEEAAVAEVEALAGNEELGRQIAAAMRADLEGRPG